MIYVLSKNKKNIIFIKTENYLFHSYNMTTYCFQACFRYDISCIYVSRAEHKGELGSFTTDDHGAAYVHLTQTHFKLSGGKDDSIFGHLLSVSI